MEKEIIKYDSEFNEAIFLSRVNNMFIKLLEAIMDNNINGVKHYLSSDIFDKYNELVTLYKKEEKTRIFDEMNVKSSYIRSYNISNDYINIEVSLTSRYMDYFIDSNGEYLSGENTHRIEKEHTIILSKKIESKDLGTARRCPGCGKTLDINNTGICPYCNSVFNLQDYDYIITSIN